MSERQNKAQEYVDVLPDLELARIDGQPARLSEARGDRNLIALFSGGAECGPCRHAIMSDVCTGTEEYAAWGATTIVVLRCSPVEAELVRRRESLTLPVLLDPTGEACRAAGALSPDGRVGAALVITDSAGRICLQSGGEHPSALPTREAILECLRNIPTPTIDHEG